MTYESLQVERDEAVGIIHINRPEALNALNRATISELRQALDELGSDHTVKALIITGTGDRAFVAGADIAELQAFASPSEGIAWTEHFHGVLFKIENLDKPVIMAINGFALGGGCELAMTGDIRIASETARLGQPEINLGLIPGGQGTQRLPRLVGKGMAKLLILTGDMINAQEALRVGLVQKVVPAADLLPTAKAMAKTLAGKPPLALAAAKRAINRGMEMDLERGCAYEVAQFGLMCATEDMTEGTTAFLEKRKPVFKGK